jgi:hypothetical protein
MGNMTEYRTSDLYEASALVASGVELLRMDPGFRGRMDFVFNETETLNQIVNDFVNGKLTLNIKTFLSAWRQLRRRIDQEEMRHERNRYYHH